MSNNTKITAKVDVVISFTIYGQPVGKGRARSAVRQIRGNTVVQHYTPQKTRNYEDAVGLAGALEMSKLGLTPLACALRVELDIRIDIPKSWSKSKQADAMCGALKPTGKPDQDNIIKAVYDGLNGICWVDDAQICEGAQRKRYSTLPGVTVTISEL